jgi:sigma-B regulation protein RsbU (phosphoserine phosphatase)
MPSTGLQKISRYVTWLELAIGFVLIVYSIYLLPIEGYWVTLLVLIVASAFSYHIKVEFQFARISQAYSVNFLAVLALGPLTGGLIAAVGVTLGDGIFRRKRFNAVLVNASVQFITTCLAGLIYFNLGGIGGIGDSARVEAFLGQPNASMFVPLLGAALIHTFVNISLLIPAVIAERRIIQQSVLMKLIRWDLISTLVFTPLSFYIFLIYYNTLGIRLIPPLIFLLVIWVLVQRTLDLNLAKSKIDLTVDRLQKITQISKAINAAGLDPEEILDIVLVNGMMVCGAPAAVIKLFEPGSQRGEFAELIRPSSENWKRFFGSDSFQTIVDYVKKTGSSLLIDEFRVDNLGPWFTPSLIDKYNLKSFLAFPILREDNVEGLLFFYGDQGNMFSRTHIETLEYLSGEIAIAIRNARIHHEIMLQNERKNEEIRLAEKVQQHVLPKSYEMENVRIRGLIHPARQLSGDYFDIVELSGSRIGIAMGDVSGKGVPASLTMMAIINSVRVLAHKVRRPNEMLKLLNESLYERDSGLDDFFQYSTGFYSILDPKTHRMTYSIAGSEKPLWWHHDQEFLSQLAGEGLPLGMFEGTKYSVEKIQLKQNDKIVFFTDGITDAMNPDGRRYGRKAFSDSVERNCLKGKTPLIDALLKDVVDFQQGAEPFDDIAIMIIEITGPPLDEEQGKTEAGSETPEIKTNGKDSQPPLFGEE